jgi:hypothetical protein
VIDEWDEWRWRCFHCDFAGDIATDDEIAKQEKEMVWLLSKKK